jgi:thiosulfate dehydrogenase [quinone] large subunit
MSIHNPLSRSAHTELAAVPGAMLSATAAKALAVLRIATGFIFLWAFLDKTFGLHYSTTHKQAWIHGGSPTEGFLKSVDVGPLQSLAHTMAGTWYANWLFMLAMLGIGIALIAGVAVRAAALAGFAMMAILWLTEFPFAQHTSAGAPSASSNPLVDYHFLYAAVLIVLAASYAGNTWGLGRVWSRLPFVSQHRWAL